MISKRFLKKSIRQTIALVERTLAIELRFKLNFFTRFLNPIFQILVIYFIFGAIFTVNNNLELGYWNSKNYQLFIFLGFINQIFRQIIMDFHGQILREKYWKTLQALMVSPLHRFILLFGILIAEICIYIVPVLIFFVIIYILYPIPIYLLFIVIFLLFCICLIYASLGLIFAVIAISKEGLTHVFGIIVNVFFWLSCIAYPLYIFPAAVRSLIILNPFYYLFDLLRIVWLMGIDYEVAIKLLTPTHIIFVISLTIFLPLISVYLFNLIYKKYGIVGY